MTSAAAIAESAPAPRPEGAGASIEASFEFFPPKTDKMAETLWRSIDRLSVLEPRFVSVTYGAGGSTRERTHDTVKRIIDETPLKPAAHLTCVEATREDVDDVLRAYWAAGVRHIVALRGDPPSGVGEAYTPHPGGYANAAELAAGAKAIGDFEISVGVYPEKHPESASFDADLDMLKAKIDAGATRGITQFFYDNAHFYRFVDRLEAAGIDIPVSPGVMPVVNFQGLKRMAAGCGASLPARLLALFDGLDDDPDTRKLVAATQAAQQCSDLVEQGFSRLHFYTLNRHDIALAICHMLGLRAGASVAAAE
ncbi:MAG: methylenetetrahydrofolate reductase [NAD(P)H] [Pseudomonadota bacterium]